MPGRSRCCPGGSTRRAVKRFGHWRSRPRNRNGQACTSSAIRGSAVSSHPPDFRSEEHTSELQSLMRKSYAVFCLKKKNINNTNATQDYCMTTHQNSKLQITSILKKY